MQYQDFTITITGSTDGSYGITALDDRGGRVSEVLPPPDAGLQAQLAAVSALPPQTHHEATLRNTGEQLFRWAIRDGIETHLRLAWERAQRSLQGLRLRLSIDAPELSAWPWELLHDPERDHTFAVSSETLLERYFDQANRFGYQAEQTAGLPLDVLLVLPVAPDLDLAQERRSIEALAASMPEALRVQVRQGVITRSDLADALLTGEYDIVHFSGHGAYLDGRGYVGLNWPDGSVDWIHSGVLSQLAVNHRSVKLVVLNICSSGRMDEGRAFQGLASQMVRYGVPAVVAMQYPVTDAAANIFAREFYKRLCLGEDAGQVDVAVTYARGMLAVLLPEGRDWVAPVLFTHAPNGVIYTLPGISPVGASSERGRVTALTASLRASLQVAEDWARVDRGKLLAWRRTLEQAERAYQGHLTDRDPEMARAARYGLTLIETRLAALDAALHEGSDLTSSRA